MTDRGDAILGASTAASEERIGCDVNVRSVVVFMSKPAQVTGRERTLQWHDALLCHGRALIAKQESNRVTRSEATGEKVCGDSIHATPHY
jgi:hypothetical protein